MRVRTRLWSGFCPPGYVRVSSCEGQGPDQVPVRVRVRVRAAVGAIARAVIKAGVWGKYSDVSRT